MNKRIIKVLFLSFAFTLLILNVFAQSTIPTLHVEVKGNGKQAIILLPGYSCSGKVWDETVNKLSSKFTCHVITFPGFAGEQAQGEADLKQWEAAVAAYIKSNKLNHPIIIGHSIGGGMAMAIAADNPDLLAKIVVVDALPCLAALFTPNFHGDEHPDCSPYVKQFASLSEDQLYKMQRKNIPALLADTSMWETAVQWSMHSDRTTLGRIYCQFANTDLRDNIAKIKCPSLILLEKNFQDNDSLMQQQYAKLEHKTIVYSTKGLHFIMYDDRDWYFQQLNAFLQ